MCSKKWEELVLLNLCGTYDSIEFADTEAAIHERLAERYDQLTGGYLCMATAAHCVNDFGSSGCVSEGMQSQLIDWWNRLAKEVDRLEESKARAEERLRGLRPTEGVPIRKS